MSSAWIYITRCCYRRYTDPRNKLDVASCGALLHRELFVSCGALLHRELFGHLPVSVVCGTGY